MQKKRKRDEPKAKKLHPIHEGINPLVKLEPLPHAHQFDFALPSIPDNRPPTAFVFGNGDFGQHGLGTDDNVLGEIKRPRLQKWFEAKVASDPDWAKGLFALECGGMHTLAIDGAGRVWSWGINDNAALGRKTNLPDVESEELESQPMLVEGLPEEGFRAVRVAAGDSVSLAIGDRGEVRCWGSFRASEGLLGFDGSAGSSGTQLKPVPLKNLEAHTIVQVATGDDHFLALTSKGQVFACGNGEQNQLGRKIVQRHKTHGLTPERLALKNIVLVGSGSYHSFAVDKAGTVYAWGLNSFRQTGVSEDKGGANDTISTPTVVDALSPSKHDGARVVQIAGGVHHTVFLLSNGTVLTCGRCDGHETGLGASHPAMVASEERKKAALALRAERQRQEHERLTEAASSLPEGTEQMSGEEAALKAQEAAAQGVPLPNPYIPEPTKLMFPPAPAFENDPTPWAAPANEDKIVHIAAGTRHNFAVAASGALYTWGLGNTSQLGLGDDEEAEVPTRVRSKQMNDYKVVHAATGGQHSVLAAYKYTADA